MTQENRQQPRALAPREDLARILTRIAEGLRSRAFWRLLIALALMDIATLTILGIAFLLIAQGLAMALVRLAPIWPPAGRLVARVAHNPDGSILFSTPVTTTWGRILIAWPAIVWVGTAALGVWLLARGGFLSQNLIYQFFFR